MKIKMIPIDKIRPSPFQPRDTFNKEKIEELGTSIKKVDLLSPIIVRKHGDTYQIIAGERRWRAWHDIGRREIPAIVRFADDIRARELSLIENWHREDLTSIERENMIDALWESEKYKTPGELGEQLGVTNNVIDTNLRSKRAREEVGVHARLSTRTMIDTGGLDTETRKKVLEKVEKEELPTHKVREFTRALKKAPEPVKKAVLKPKSRITPEIAERIKKLPSEEHMKEAIKIIESEEGFHEEAREIRLREIEDIAEGKREIPVEVEDMNEAIVLSYKNASESIYKLLASRVEELPKKHREACIGYMLKANDFLTRQISLLRREGLLKDIEIGERVLSIEEKK